jgi:multiple antibiotic resistance protein
MEWYTIAFILFLIMDPLGNISSFLGLVKEIPRKEVSKIVIREMLIALSIMLLFNFIGEYLFDLLHVSEKTVRITGAVILFLSAIKILFPTIDSPRNNLPPGEPYIVPLAVPLIASPALLAMIMLFAHIVPNISLMLMAILSAWLASSFLLLNANRIQKVLGANGLVAIERLMGMILVLIAIQKFLEGIQLFVKSCKLG